MIAPGERGISPGWIGESSFNTPAGLALLKSMAALGCVWVRIDVDWSGIQPNNASSFDWSFVDACVANILAAGMKPLLCIVQSPGWAGGGGWNPPANPADYGTFCGKVAARYAPRGCHWFELWNEPNLSLFWRSGADPAKYGEMVKAAATAIHAADSQSVVITAGLSPAATGNGSIEPVEFLAALYANASAQRADAIGWHPYCYPSLPSQYATWSSWSKMAATPTSARSVMAANGDAAKKIWMTEFGAPTNVVTEAAQAAMLTDAYVLAQSYQWAGPLIWYNYQDDTGAASGPFGLVRADGWQKPSAAAYAAVARNAGVPPVSGLPPICLWTNHNWPDGAAFDQARDQFTNVMGRSPTMIMCYCPMNGTGDGGFPMAQWPAQIDGLMAGFAADSRTKPPAIPVLAFAPGSAADGQQFAATVAGQWDGCLTGVLAACLKHGYKSLYLRAGHEMNGTWYPWSVNTGNAALFVQAFQHIAKVARDYAAANGMTIKIVWNPNAGGVVPIAAMWPGKASVDVIGLDQYSEPIDSNWNSSYAPMAPAGPDNGSVNWSQLVALAKANGLPIAWSEVGGTNAAFAQQIAQASSNAIVQGVPLDYIGMYVDPDWADGSMPATAAAWVAGFGPNGSVVNGAAVPPVTVPPVKVTPSPDNTQVGPGVVLGDNDGNSWLITPDAKVSYNGVPIAYTGRVTYLAKANGGLIWQFGSGVWWPFGPVDAAGVPASPFAAGISTSPIVAVVVPPPPGPSYASLKIAVDAANALVAQAGAALAVISDELKPPP